MTQGVLSQWASREGTSPPGDWPVKRGMRMVHVLYLLGLHLFQGCVAAGTHEDVDYWLLEGRRSDSSFQLLSLSGLSELEQHRIATVLSECGEYPPRGYLVPDERLRFARAWMEICYRYNAVQYDPYLESLGLECALSEQRIFIPWMPSFHPQLDLVGGLRNGPSTRMSSIEAIERLFSHEPVR